MNGFLMLFDELADDLHSVDQFNDDIAQYDMQINSKNDNTWFVRIIHWFFAKCSLIVCFCPWTCMIITTIVTLVLSAKIPLTRMQNDISDFTPYGARSRSELLRYREFFSNHGEPKAIYAFITSKHGSNLLGIAELNETVQVLDAISRDFYLNTISGPKNFETYCSGFCLLNEPVRHFYSGMLISGEHGTDSSHLDLGYPVTTVLGTKLYMDPNFFGVKIAVDEQNVVSVADNSAFGESIKQVPNNIREVSLIVLQFRAEIGDDVEPLEMRQYERNIVDHFHQEYQSDNINVYILADSFITEEIVRAGLTLLPFLVIGFTIMAVFSSATFVISAIFQKQMSYNKIVLAVMACVCPFMACGATLGGMFLAGFRFGSILCVTPFLVLAIGVDDAYLMVNAWQRITSHRRMLAKREGVEKELITRITEMFIETGPSITITTITNVLAFGIGATTPAAEIQLFSIGNALAVLTDFVFTITLYGALMAVVGKYEIQNEFSTSESDASSQSSAELENSQQYPEPPKEKPCEKMIIQFCSILTNKWMCSLILGLLAVYWYVCIVGAMNIKSELSPIKLFLQNSEIVEIFQQRKSHIIPYYSACWILVDNPGDISDPAQREKLDEMMKAFESLPSANGKYSTKFWLRDYEDFLKQSDDIDLPDEEEEENEFAIEFSRNGSQSVTPSQIVIGQGNELKQFLEWPEFSFWSGFIQYEENPISQQYVMKKFLAITAFHGSDLVEWSQRAKLLNEWRVVADQYKSLNVSVYEEDAKFLDLIETMAPVAMQSALWTFASMFVVAALFISHPTTLFVATFSILSTSIGVFGIMSWWGADLDPIMMSATVMSIGFSVDIPSHISYHYFQTESSNIRRRIYLTIESVGFPILEASLSTSLCVISLFFVDLNMAHIFGKCMLLVVVIGLIHGMLVMPVIFSLLDTVPRKFSPKSRAVSTVTASTVICNDI
ncbi:unnamed protein product [Caenorhabditis bovis]|uniref:SSD domain-containing protein n=1 Tax=Caenorhabditis bovis TaxID=2654633 RepID=A0A8S1EX22_9PELO|nr:unnamed protein product [Caenorhabditis bovis]